MGFEVFDVAYGFRSICCCIWVLKDLVLRMGFEVFDVAYGFRV